MISSSDYSLQEKLHALVERELIDHVGVADLVAVRGEIQRQGGAVAAQFPRGISLGIDLPQAIVDALPERQERAVATSYRRLAYDVINDRLNLAASRVGSLLQRAGYRSFPVGASDRVDDSRICALVSHKLVAHCAGLGWIGRSCLLVTPEAGPRVRWVTVLTDAPLEPTGTALESRCGGCSECVDSCPVQAFTGREFVEGEPREARYDAAKCDQYFKEIQRAGAWNVCGLCLFSCPQGRTAQSAK